MNNVFVLQGLQDHWR